MKTELLYLVYVTVLTGLLWVPYILDRMATWGLTDTVGYPDSPKPQSPWARRLLKAHSNAVENLRGCERSPSPSASSPRPSSPGRSWCAKTKESGTDHVYFRGCGQELPKNVVRPCLRFLFLRRSQSIRPAKRGEVR